MMKAINWFLLILIVIGIGAFASQKFWVPKLVARIIASETAPPALVEAAKPNMELLDGRYCFTYSSEATASEPYAVNELVDINIVGKDVTGRKTGVQNGPDMNNGYFGSLSGVLDKNNLSLIFAYTVEGSSNKEREIYRTSRIGIEKMRYPLVEENGILVPDTSKEFKVLSYKKVSCEESN